MAVKRRARSDAQKAVRESTIVDAAEALLRRAGYDAMTMQAVATASGLAKGTLYLYFNSRETLVLAVYGRLFDRWVDDFAMVSPDLTGFDQLCDDFARSYARDPLFLQLAGFAASLLEPHLSADDFIVAKRLMARRVKRLSGIVCSRMKIDPVAAQHLVWRLLTIAGGTAQMTVSSRLDASALPDDVRAFAGLAEFHTVFLNAAKPT